MVFKVHFLPYNDVLEISKQSLRRFPDSLLSTMLLDDTMDNTYDIEIPGGGRFTKQIFEIYEYGSTTIPRESQHFAKFFDWLKFLGLSMHPKSITKGLESISNFCMILINTSKNKSDIYYILEFPNTFLKCLDIIDFELARRGFNCRIEHTVRIPTEEFSKYQSIFYAFNSVCTFPLPEDNTYTITNRYETIGTRNGFKFIHEGDEIWISKHGKYHYIATCRESYEPCHTLFHIYDDMYSSEIGKIPLIHSMLDYSMAYKKNSILRDSEILSEIGTISKITVAVLHSKQELYFTFDKVDETFYERYCQNNEYQHLTKYDSCVKVTSY